MSTRQRRGGDGRWMENLHLHDGALRARLGIRPGQKIPESVLREAERSHDRTEAREARLAETLRQFHGEGK